MRYVCPVCGFNELPYPPRDYHICPCCGTEFGKDDAEFSQTQLRELWVATRARWFFGNPPQYWNPWIQLIRAGHSETVPKFATKLTTNTTIKIGPHRNLTDSPSVILAAS